MAKASAGKGAGKAKKGKGGAAAEGKKRRKKKAPRDPNRPKRATIAFMFFSNEQRPRVLRSSPQMHLSEVSKVLGAKWRGMDARAKAPYEAKAAAARLHVLLRGPPRGAPEEAQAPGLLRDLQAAR